VVDGAGVDEQAAEAASSAAAPNRMGRDANINDSFGG